MMANFYSYKGWVPIKMVPQRGWGTIISAGCKRGRLMMKATSCDSIVDDDDTVHIASRHTDPRFEMNARHAGD
jgi:hypothetical protein